MNSSRDSIVALMCLAMKVLGVPLFIKNKSLFVRYWMFTYSCIVFGTMIAGNIILVCLSDNVIISLEHLSVIVGALEFMLVQINSVLKARQLRMLVRSLQKNNDHWSAVTRNFEIKLKISHTRIVLYHKWITVYNIVAFILVATFPVFSVWLKITKLGDEFSLLYTSWYPWDRQKAFGYTQTYLIQVLSGSVLQIVMYATVAFNVLVVCLFVNDFEELANVLDKLKAVEVKDANRLLSKEKQEVGYNVDEVLQYCVMRHQYIMRNFNLYRKWFEPSYAIYLATYVAEFLLLGFSFFGDSDKRNYQARNGVFMVTMTSSLYVHCLIGEKFFSMNESICQILYSLPWYRWNLKKKRVIHIFMSQTRYPLELKAFKTFNASLVSFSHILKLSYSYLNLLLTTLKQL